MRQDPVKELAGSLTPALVSWMGTPTPDYYKNNPQKQLRLYLSGDDWQLLDVVARGQRIARGVVLSRMWSLFCRALRTGRDPATGEPLHLVKPALEYPPAVAEAIATRRKGVARSKNMQRAVELMSAWTERQSVPADVYFDEHGEDP